MDSWTREREVEKPKGKRAERQLAIERGAVVAAKLAAAVQMWEEMFSGGDGLKRLLKEAAVVIIELSK